jgi:hypothetical protein
VPLVRSLFAAVMVEAASVLPVHGVLSLGSQEAVWVAALGAQGTDAASAAGLGLCVHAALLVMSALAAAAASLARRAEQRPHRVGAGEREEPPVVAGEELGPEVSR